MDCATPTRNSDVLGAPHRPDVNVITANPKTAGVARWNFLALWGHRMNKGDAAAEEFVTKARSPVIRCNEKHNEVVFEAWSSCASTLSFCPIVLLLQILTSKFVSIQYLKTYLWSTLCIARQLH